MSKALVVYHSVHGNTEKVAKALAKGLENSSVTVDCKQVDAVEFNKLSQYDLLVIGGPTHSMGISKPIDAFLERLKTAGGLSGMRAFAFDTKTKGWLAGSAGAKIDGKLEKIGLVAIRPHASAVVKGMKGPLEEGTEETFRQIGAELTMGVKN